MLSYSLRRAEELVQHLLKNAEKEAQYGYMRYLIFMVFDWLLRTRATASLRSMSFIDYGPKLLESSKTILFAPSSMGNS
ncbi:hypothetical protein KSP39_PZI009881 [Platanthera zijinensis]|uniref:Uncharacterized protein n=1 Tax=Platanthera zijinensis TaxID=2320716 RepID=A0AAP0BJA1_9ASPA